MAFLSDLIFKTSQFLAFQVGELPNPVDSRPDQRWGNFGIIDFLGETWPYFVGVAIIVFLMIFSKRQKRKQDLKTQKEKDLERQKRDN